MPFQTENLQFLQTSNLNLIKLTNINYLPQIVYSLQNQTKQNLSLQNDIHTIIYASYNAVL